MALVNGHVSITMVDQVPFRTSVPIYFQIPDTATVAQARTELGNLVASFNLVTGAKIIDADMRLLLALPSANDPTGFDLNESVGLRYYIVSTARHSSVVIPAAAAATLSGGQPVITEDGVLDTFADILESAMVTTGTTTGFYTNPEYQQLSGPADAFRPDRSLAKRRRSATLRRGV